MRRNTLAFMALAMAAPTAAQPDKTDKTTTPTTPARGAAPAPPDTALDPRRAPAPAEASPAQPGDRPAPPDEVAALRERLAQLEGERSRFDAEWMERERRHEEELRAARARSTAPGRPRDRGEVVEFKARHRLHFTAGGEKVAVNAGDTFRASPEDMDREGLVEGDHFDVIGG